MNKEQMTDEVTRIKDPTATFALMFSNINNQTAPLRLCVQLFSRKGAIKKIK